jgi:hypothetical protein
MKSSARLLVLFAICLSFCAIVQAANKANSSDQHKVTLLGTGTPYPSADRFGASILVEADGKKLLFDCGRGASDSPAAIVNASYPDCVNLALHRLGLRVTCGIGNAAIVEAFCRSHPKTKSADVRVIGHHGHLSPWLQAKSSAALPRAWIKGCEDDPLRFRPMLAAAGEELNDVTSSTSVSILLALLSGETLRVSTPGVAGLPGGYPFLLKRGKFSLRLPRGITREQAIAHNKSGEHADGLDLGPAVKFIEPARRALAAVNFEFAEGFCLRGVAGRPQQIARLA